MLGMQRFLEMEKCISNQKDLKISYKKK